jgi:hypothetical protein
MLLAFSDVYWENGTEAEVYALMSLAQVLVFWLGLRWWEAHEKRPTAGPLLVAVYLMWVSVGLHLGSAWRPAAAGAGVAGRPARGLGVHDAAAVGAVRDLGSRAHGGRHHRALDLTFIYFAWQKKLPGWLVLAA